jgi:predicted esterase
MRRLSGISLCALMALSVTPTLAFAKDKQSDLFKDLDSVKTKKDLAKLATKLDKTMSANQLRDALLRGRSELTAFAQREGTVDVTDQIGRTTKLHYVVPNGEAPEGGYGILLALHGLNAPARQLFSLFRSTANQQKWILISPGAQRLPFGGTTAPTGRKVEGNEDIFGFEPLPQWWAYRSYGFPMAAISKIKKHYKINTNKIMMSGFSMGGYATWNLGLRFPDRFAALAPLSGSISRREKFGIVDSKTRLLVSNGRRVPLFFVHGAKDGMVPPNSDRYCRDRLKELGGNFIYQESPESNHGLRFWFGDKSKPKSLCDWMKKQSRNPAPKIVEHVSIGDYMNRNYWLEMTGRKGASSTIKGTVKEGNRIEIEATNLKTFRVYLDSRLVNVTQPVTIVCNGEVIFTGKASGSVKNVLNSWFDREDTELLYSHAVDCIVGKKTAPAPKKRPETGSTKPKAKAKAKTGKWY